LTKETFLGDLKVPRSLNVVIYSVFIDLVKSICILEDRGAHNFVYNLGHPVSGVIYKASHCFLVYVIWDVVTAALVNLL